MNRLNLTFGGKLTASQSILYNKIAVEIENAFTIAIETISKQHSKNIDWWISSPASRNTIVSPLFHYCCCIALLQKLIKKNDTFAEILVDSMAFKIIIENYLVKQGIYIKVILVRLPVKHQLKELFLPIYTMFGLPLRHLFLYFVVRLTRSLRKALPDTSLTLMDTFVMPGYIEKDRYYPGLLETLSKEEKKRICFVPQLYGFKPWQFIKVVKLLSKAQKNYILKDDFLQWSDYLCLWQYIFRVRKLQIKSVFFYGVDVSPLVCEELNSFCGIKSAYAPLLNYHFAKRLNEAGIKLKLVIGWFENQNIDRGWNAGFRQFFPETETVGYQGFIVSTHYLCMFPTKEEKKNRVIPHKVAVIGKGLIQSARRFCSDLDVCIAPAFRFQHVWKKRKYFPDIEFCTILVALPMMIDDSLNLLGVLNTLTETKKDNIRFLIKPHPTVSPVQIQNAFGFSWPVQFEFVDGDFNDCIEKSDMLISSASSACMETLAKGIPVIIIGNNHGLTHNPVPENITEDIWRVCYTPQEVSEAIQFYQDRTPEKIREHRELGKKIRDAYFELVTMGRVGKFLERSL